ncbi:MAG: hypothetical protein MUP97_16000 [Acidimicrobiia bacterium]|nr:hypothetical protein [Acidimicrobiia bacterium]
MSTVIVPDKCFFHVDDGGASYYLVSRDLVQDAAKKRVWLGDDATPPQSVLSACVVGDWFSSEI